MTEIVEERVCCPTCDMEFGKLKKFGSGELELLMIHGIPVKSITCFCPRCHQDFHWYVTDKYIQKLIERANGNLAKTEKA